MQLYAKAGKAQRSTGSTSDEIRKLAEQLEKQHPDLVVSRMTKTLRPGKVFIDWSQNNPAKTTVTRLLAARPPPADRQHADQLGRGRRLHAAPSSSSSRPRTCWNAPRQTATCSRQFSVEGGCRHGRARGY